MVGSRHRLGGSSGEDKLHHAVENKRVTVLGPRKKKQVDYMSHRGVGGGVEG